MHRVVSVVKMRNSDHDRTLREFTIGRDGLTILSPEQTAGGVLEALGRVGAKGLRAEDCGLSGAPGRADSVAEGQGHSALSPQPFSSRRGSPAA
jgi:hypothetical protein